MRIALLSDTHQYHGNDLTNFLKTAEVDLILHAGDISSRGYEKELRRFVNWFDSLPIKNKVFIAGNHEIGLLHTEKKQEILRNAKSIYLQDQAIQIEDIKIYGSPWQPEFFNWEFNLPRQGEELRAVWNAIPNDTDILITHGPAWGHVDTVITRPNEKLGCELLRERINEIKPKIHLCGHIHTGNGYYYDGHTHFFNASVLNEQYHYAYDPFVFDWNPITNEIVWE